MTHFNFNGGVVAAIKECSDETLSIFEKLGFSEMNWLKFFNSFSKSLYFWFLWKYEPPSLHFIFGW